MPQFMTFFPPHLKKKIFLRYAQPCFCRSMIIMFHVKYISWGDGMYQRATFEQNKHVLTCVDILLWSDLTNLHGQNVCLPLIL